MNNNIKFDPMTGEPINNTEEFNTTIENQTQEQVVEQNPVAEPIQNLNIQSELQNIPTVEQNKQDFIENVQSMNKEKKEEKKEGVNFIFVIILFAVLLAAIYFLFPILLDYI